MLKILSISRDLSIFRDGSVARERMVRYGSICDELHIIIPANNLQLTTHNRKTQISKNVFAYPSFGLNKFMALVKVYSVGLKILDLKLKNEKWLVTAQDPFETGFIAWLIARKTKVRLQLQIHTDFLSPFFSKESFLNKIRIIMAKFLLPRADGIRVVSQRIKDSIKAKSLKLKAVPVVLPIRPNSPIVERNNVGDFLKNKYPTFRNFILMVGRLEREKNISLAIGAFAEVSKSFGETALVIVGGGSLEDSLEKEAKRLGIEDKVFFEGWKENLEDYYESASIFLHASSYEGYGLALFEAGVAGLPIVSTNVGIAEEMQNSGSAIFLADGDKDKVAGVIKKALESLPEAREKAIKGRENLLKMIISEEEYLKRYRMAWEKCL